MRSIRSCFYESITNHTRGQIVQKQNRHLKVSIAALLWKNDGEFGKFDFGNSGDFYYALFGCPLIVL